MSRVPEPSGREPHAGSVPERRAGDEFDDDDLAADEAAAVVESDIAELHNERTELVDTLRRVQADFENYRKRVLREQTALVDRATDRLVEGLLPVLDSFEGALASITPDTPERSPPTARSSIPTSTKRCSTTKAPPSHASARRCAPATG